MRKMLCLPILFFLASCCTQSCSPTVEQKPTSANKLSKAENSKQRLFFKKELMPKIKSGEKQVTIRRGKRLYKPGQRVIGRCSGKESVPLEITEFKQLPLREVPLQDLKDDGFQSAEDALQFLRRWYSDMTLDSTVSVIRFRKCGEKQKPAGASDAAATAVPTVVEPQ